MVVSCSLELNCTFVLPHYVPVGRCKNRPQNLPSREQIRAFITGDKPSQGCSGKCDQKCDQNRVSGRTLSVKHDHTDTCKSAIQRVFKPCPLCVTTLRNRRGYCTSPLESQPRKAADGRFAFVKITPKPEIGRETGGEKLSSHNTSPHDRRGGNAIMPPDTPHTDTHPNELRVATQIADNYASAVSCSLTEDPPCARC